MEWIFDRKFVLDFDVSFFFESMRRAAGGHERERGPLTPQLAPPSPHNATRDSQSHVRGDASRVRRSGNRGMFPDLAADQETMAIMEDQPSDGMMGHGLGCHSWVQ